MAADEKENLDNGLAQPLASGPRSGSGWSQRAPSNSDDVGNPTKIARPETGQDAIMQVLGSNDLSSDWGDDGNASRSTLDKPAGPDVAGQFFRGYVLNDEDVNVPVVLEGPDLPNLETRIVTLANPNTGRNLSQPPSRANAPAGQPADKAV